MTEKKLQQTFESFSDLLFETQIIDPRYPVKGCYIWLPYGLAIRENFIKTLKKPLEKRGYSEYLFPRLVPEEHLAPLEKIIKNPKKGVFWVTRAGDKNLERPLFLYPTGECPIYSMFKVWIKSVDDLPLKLFQISTIFRPTKDTSILINGAESDSLMEGHTAHSTKEEALAEFWESVEIMKEYYSEFAIPIIVVKRPFWGNKPVSEMTLSFETYLPVKNKSFSPSVTYHQSQIFSKPFDIKFKTKNGASDFTYQNTFGIAERVLAPIFLLHADEFGLCLLPELAPVQIVIVPIFNKKNKKKVMQYVEKIKKELSESRVFVDLSDKIPSARFFKWRKRGVPIRIGAGTRDIENNSVSFIRRDLEKKETVKLKSLKELIPKALNEIKKSLYLRAKKIFDYNFVNVSTKNELKNAIENKKISKFLWCEEKECGISLEKEVKGEILGSLIDKKAEGACLNCGGKAKAVAVFAQRCTSP